ncbi:phage baseplate assembly protein V [Kordiimonas marina]|uniref:phage baseplate assembly protein V n=1 Tax=Kordiimonas marina TaxID=2872312 RepID=UPI001FF3EEBC|nr:phage baseplate assembly protein V [Kordiimonas marina]MCJ9429313.1 phage baseplate assembly protein V [Kordiimonas marina]
MNEAFQTIEKSIRKQQTTYYGKYRAFVADNDDPDGLGRIKMTIPSVLGEATSDWALPAVAYGGGADFGVLWVPPVGAQVLAEFLEGDPSAPVWAATFWRQASEMPAEYQGPSTKILKTESGHLLTFEDKEGEEQITLHSKAEAELVMDKDGGITLTDSAGSKVVLDAAGGQIQIEDANGNSMVMSSSGIDCKDASGNEIKMSGSGVDIKSSAVVNIEGSSVTVAGAGGEPIVKGTTFLALFNSHVHPTVFGPSGPPVVPLTPAALTIKSTAQ